MPQDTIPDLVRSDGTPIYAGRCTSEEWNALKADSVANPDDFRMGCCGARAVLKTSLYGVQFAAHHSNECATAPETIWHISAKDAVLGALALLGLPARQEVSGGAKTGRWRADVLTEVGSQKIAFELQRSYQHLRDYERRQRRYELSGVKCAWLLRLEVARPLITSIASRRRKEEFGGKWPAGGSVSPALSSFHWMMYDADRQNAVFGPGFQSYNTTDWVSAVVNGKMVYDASVDTGRWVVRP